MFFVPLSEGLLRTMDVYRADDESDPSLRSGFRINILYKL
jgi:hypothetical protein